VVGVRDDGDLLRPPLNRICKQGVAAHPCRLCASVLSLVLSSTGTDVRIAGTLDTRCAHPGPHPFRGFAQPCGSNVPAIPGNAQVVPLPVARRVSVVDSSAPRAAPLPDPAPDPRVVQPVLQLPPLRRVRPRRPVAAAVFRRSRERPVEVVVAEVPGLVRADQLPAPTARDDPQDDLLLPALTISTMNLPVASSHRLPRSSGLAHDHVRLSGGDIPDGSGSWMTRVRELGAPPYPGTDPSRARACGNVP
jgi:hypothetical protein